KLLDSHVAVEFILLNRISVLDPKPALRGCGVGDASRETQRFPDKHHTTDRKEGLKEHQMISEPKLEQREAQPYAAVKVETPIRGMSTAGRKAMQKTEKWLAKKGITPSGAPFWRYKIINMEGMMHLEVGFPTETLVEGDGTVV